MACCFNASTSERMHPLKMKELVNSSIPEKGLKVEEMAEGKQLHSPGNTAGLSCGA